MSAATTAQPVTNFGGNVRFRPRARYAPRTEAEVLQILDRHARDRVRAVGSLHSWSDIAATEGALLDMRHFRDVEIRRTGDMVVATVGAGCRLNALLRALDRQAGVTLPTIPAVLTQAIAGAISTGTHGSGMPSLSHFVEGVRVAAYDSDTGRARIYEWTDGPELRAARCGLGCVGILLSITVRCVPRYSILQRVTRVATVDAVLASEREFPLQQTLLLPYAWEFVIFQRRSVPAARTTVLAHVFRLYWRAFADAVFHVVLVPVVNVMRRDAVTRWFVKDAAPKMLWMAPAHVDDSTRILTLRHEWFEHLEMEVFVPARHLRRALEDVRAIVSLFAGDAGALPPEMEARLGAVGSVDLVVGSRGTYVHHYPLLIRRILPDDTLMSMTSGAEEPYYSISVFTYSRDKSQMFPLARLMALTLTRQYGARLHWGKHVPLGPGDLAPLYPGRESFREVCLRIDPDGVFGNGFTDRVMALRP